jgi:DNA-binding NarL/FixJ family response regulator
MEQSMLRVKSRSSEVSVLLLDDDQDWLDGTVELLQSQGVQRVDTARTKEDAEKKISSNEYDVVLADIELQQAKFHGRETERGDEWLLRNIKEIAPATIKAAVTADPKRIHDIQALEQNGIRVAVKSLESEQEILDEIVSLAREQRDLNHRLGEVMVQNAAELFLDWLNTRQDQVSPDIWLGTRRMSVRDIAREVSDDSEVGQRFLSMFIEHLRLRIRLKKPSSPVSSSVEG